MANTIYTKSSQADGVTPHATNDLKVGELAVNTRNNKLFMASLSTGGSVGDTTDAVKWIGAEIVPTTLGSSDTKIPTEASVKTYVDAQVTAGDLDISADSGSNIAIDLDSEVLSVAGGEGIDTSITGNEITIKGEDSSTSNKGIASFSSANFAVSSGAVTVKDGGIVLAELAADSVDGTKLVDDAVNSEHYAAGSIDTAHIGNDQITNALMADDAVDTAQLVDDCVTAALIEDGAVGTAAYADDSISGAKLKDGVIGNAKMENSKMVVSDGFSASDRDFGSTIVIQGTANEVNVSQDGGTFTIGQPDDVTIAGNLTVNGATTTVSTATLSVEDPLIILASDNDADSVDVGIYAKYVASGTKYSGLFRDASDSDKWKLFATSGNSHAAPTTTVNTTSGFTLGTLVADTFEGALTGNASGSSATCSGLAGSATVLETSRNFQTNLASTSSAGFTGAAACNPGVTGTLAAGNGGTGLTSVSTLLNSNVTSVSGNAGTATVLATSRAFRANLASTTAVGFTGAADCSPGVTGTLAVGNGGTGLTGISTLLNSNVTSVSGNAGTATVLATSRNFQTNLASTSAAGFTGAAACSPGVTGTLAVGNGGTGLTSLSTFLLTSSTIDGGAFDGS